LRFVGGIRRKGRERNPLPFGFSVLLRGDRDFLAQDFDVEGGLDRPLHGGLGEGRGEVGNRRLELGVEVNAPFNGSLALGGRGEGVREALTEELEGSLTGAATYGPLWLGCRTGSAGPFVSTMPTISFAPSGSCSSNRRTDARASSSVSHDEYASLEDVAT